MVLTQVLLIFSSVQFHHCHRNIYKRKFQLLEILKDEITFCNNLFGVWVAGSGLVWSDLGLLFLLVLPFYNRKTDKNLFLHRSSPWSADLLWPAELYHVLVLNKYK